MAGLGAAGIVQLVGTGVTAASTIAAGESQRREAEFRRKEAEIIANNEKAAAQREAIEARRQTRIAQSRALALAERGDDKTVIDIMDGIQQSGEMAALSALYNGSERARSMEMRGDALRRSGRQAQTAGLVSAGNTLVAGGESLYQKYGRA